MPRQDANAEHHSNIIEEPKDGDWTPLNKNVFVGHAAGRWSSSEVLKMATESYCTCSLEDECGTQCLNRIVQYECDDSNCRSKGVCQNRAFATLRRKVEAKFDLGIETYKTRSKGYGLKTKQAFERDQIIVEYTGEIVTREQSRYRRTSTRKADQVSLAAAFTMLIV